VFSSSASQSIPENSTTTLSVIATDAQTPVSFEILDGPDASRFVIDAQSETLRFLAPPDFERPTDSDQNNKYELQIQARDALGQTTVQNLTVSVTPVNEAPSEVKLPTTTLLENQPIGTPVGLLETSDPDSGDTFTYSLVPGVGAADNALFQVVDGVLQTNSVFDFETQSGYSVRIRSTDANGLGQEKVFALSIINVDDPLVIKVTPAPTTTPTGKRIAVDASALVQYQNSTNLKNTRVVFTIKEGAQAPDQLDLISNGKGTDQLKIAGGKLKLGKTALGTATGGKKGQPLTLTFNVDINVSLVQRVVRSVGFQTHKANRGIRQVEIQAINEANASNSSVTKIVIVGN
jgi:hypothetical protein